MPATDSLISEPARTFPGRLTSLDAYRGLAMFLMAAELMNLPRVAEHFPDSRWWGFLGDQQSHVAWTGCSLHDMIQPSFTFMVGVALPFSLAGRMARQQSRAVLWGHALWRSLILVLLGVFLRSLHTPITNWTFEDTLSQIGLGYPFLFALGWMGRKAAWGALAVILAGYWAFFAAWPLPPPDFDWEHFRGHRWFEGFAAHWNQNGNAAWAFDRWFLNLFPREREFLGNSGGYSTLSFIPTLGTMILGLIAGRWLKDQQDAASGQDSPKTGEWTVIRKLVLTGVLCLAAGWALDRTGWCPSVKKIWTPAWVLFSGGWCFLAMAAFYLVADVWKQQRLFLPLTIIGLNSIAMYVLVDGFGGFTKTTLTTHLGTGVFESFGKEFAPLLHGAAALLVLWLILLWMHRRRLYLRI